MEIIFKYLGGSRAYGLETENSDQDIRGVFLHSDPRYILGLDRFEHYQIESEDIKYKELVAFFKLLRKGNSECIETLFYPTWEAIYCSTNWQYITSYKKSLIDPKNLLNCLKGYAYSELKLANGERTGRLGSKRIEQVSKYGFSPKNFVQLLRLCYCGATFFESGAFPVNLKTFNSSFRDQLLEIKMQPEKFTKEKLNGWAESAITNLDSSYDKYAHRLVYRFDERFVNGLCLELYLPILRK